MVARLSNEPKIAGMPTPLPQPVMVTWRCPACGRILAKLALGPGSVCEVKCSCNVTSTKRAD